MISWLFVWFFSWIGPLLVSAPEVRVLCQEMPLSENVE